MITPTKYLNLDTCALNIAAHTIHLLLSNGPMKFDELCERLENDLGEGARYGFPQAVGLLYLLGRLEYSDESDAFHIKTSYHR